MCCVVSRSFKVLLMNNQRLLFPLPIFSSQTYEHYNTGLSPSSTLVRVTSLSSRFPWGPSQPRLNKNKTKLRLMNALAPMEKEMRYEHVWVQSVWTWQKKAPRKHRSGKGKKTPARSPQTQVQGACTPCTATLWWFHEHIRWSGWRGQGFLWPTVLKVSVRCFGWSSWFWPLTKAVPQSTGTG